MKEMCTQSVNATSFSSQEIIPFLLHLNAVYDGPTIKIWVFTEAKTGQVRLDTHLSYVNLVMKEYVKNYNDIDPE